MTDFNKYHIIITLKDKNRYKLNNCGDIIYVGKYLYNLNCCNESSYIPKNNIGKIVCQCYVTSELKERGLETDINDIREVKIMNKRQVLSHFKYY